MFKKPYFNLFGKIYWFFYLFGLCILNLGLFNIQEMRVPNSHVAFSPKNNFQELQLHQTLNISLNFGTCEDHSILDKSVSVILKIKFGFNFIYILVFFQKYAITSIHKNPEIYVNIYYFANRGFLICLGENFKAIA